MIKKLIPAFLLFLGLLSPLQAKAPEAGVFSCNKYFSVSQCVVLTYAWHIAVADGIEPAVLQGILLQESKEKFRVAGPSKSPYFGVGQIKLPTALAMLQKWPELYDKFDFDTKHPLEVQAKLMLDDEFNIAVASKYLRYLKSTFKFSGDKLIDAYNMGPGGPLNGMSSGYSTVVRNQVRTHL